MEEKTGFTKAVITIILSLLIFFFIFSTLITMSNLLIGTSFLFPNHAILFTFVWSAYKIIR